MNQLDLNHLQNAVNRRGKAVGWVQGTFQPTHPEKYIGYGNPTYRSSWEKRVMEYMDRNENVIRWGSETLQIKYVFELSTNGKQKNYYVDFYCEIRNQQGTVEKVAIEVKPDTQTRPPIPPKNKTAKAMKNYLYSVSTYVKNQNKWKSAKIFCEKQGIRFMLLTENDLFKK